MSTSAPVSLAERFAQPTVVSDVDVAFPTNVAVLLPPCDELPDEFKRWLGNVWCRAASKLFFSGGVFPPTKPGIDRVAALRHIRVCLGSWQPKHEHKAAGVAYLMSLWCESAEIKAVGS